MKNTKWRNFFEDKVIKIFEKQKEIIDIGGGLRIDKTKNNRFDADNYSAFSKYIQDKNSGVNYRIMDPVPDYNPDLVGDIHKIPLADNSIDAIFCIAVLEHVEDPIRAVAECKRILRPGGEAVFYVPFLYYYHAEVGYYGDFWRFTADTCDYLFKDMKVYEKCAVRGKFQTLGRLTGKKILEQAGYYLDKLLPSNSKQVSGYYIYIQK